MACNCQEVAEKGKQKVEESFALVLLKSYKKAFATITIILSIIILGLIGYIVYDAYTDSLYDTFSYKQDGDGVNNINNGKQGDLNVPEVKN